MLGEVEVRSSDSLVGLGVVLELREVLEVLAKPSLPILAHTSLKVLETAVQETAVAQQISPALVCEIADTRRVTTLEKDCLTPSTAFVNSGKFPRAWRRSSVWYLKPDIPWWLGEG